MTRIGGHHIFVMLMTFSRVVGLGSVESARKGFAMSYSCEYQAEIQSALWSRASVTLFTAAVFYKDTTKTYLICSNTNDKGKDTVYTFVNRLYEHIMLDVPTAGNAGDIFSDGPPFKKN